MEVRYLEGGGWTHTLRTCLTFTSGQWIQSHTLQYSRYDHSTWVSDHGIILLGGYDSLNTERLTEAGVYTQSFALDFSAR